MIAKNSVSKAILIRDDSLAAVEPPLEVVRIPDPLPMNVVDIPKNVLTEGEMRITSLDVEDLLAEIRSRRLSCLAVTRAFLRRAALAQHLVNCITELLVDRAIERAEYLDSLSGPIGPLHGLPVSIKEHHGMRGCLTNCALVAMIEDETAEVSGVNDVLWEAGAVFYARTTQPQSLMHLETSSNIYGVTLNPYNLGLSPGGSSGGESALISLRGSVLGIGGDSGGSIRVPAANTGIYGFKPTSGRLSRRGTRNAVRPGDGIQGSHGPLSTTRFGLEVLMRSYLQYQPWYKDPTLVPLPWRSVELPKTLKIAIMWSDGIVKPHPPVLRALHQVVSVLGANKGQFDTVEWHAYQHDRCWRITHSLYFEDAGVGMRKILAQGGEEALPLTDWLLNSENVKERTVEELSILKAERNEYRLAYNDYWQATGATDGHPVDAILCPVGPGAAPPHGYAKYWSYSSQWNMLEYPAVVFPVTQVDPTLDQKEVGYVAMNEQDQWNYDLYDPSRYADAPVGLQLVTRRFEDEKCLAILAKIEQAMGRK